MNPDTAGCAATQTEPVGQVWPVSPPRREEEAAGPTRQRLPSATADKCSIHLIADGVAPTSIQNESTLIKRGGFPLGLGDSPPPNHATRQTPSAVIFLLSKTYSAPKT